MYRRCNDPVCPANRHLLSQKSGKNKVKERKPSTSRQISVTSSTVSQPQKTKSKTRAKSSKKSKEPTKKSKTVPSCTKNCKNKKCQASKPTVECSTSTYPPQKTCAPRHVYRDPEAIRRQIGNNQEECCICTRRNSYVRAKSPRRSNEAKRRKGRRKSCCRRKKSAKRESDRKNELLTALCICVRSPSSQELETCKYASSYAMLAKHNECCCQHHNSNKSQRKEARSKIKHDGKRSCAASEHRFSNERHLPFQCPCTSPSMPTKTQPENECSQSVLVRGLSCVRKGIEKLNASAMSFFNGDNSEVHAYECKPCPVHNNCQGTPVLRKRSRYVSQKRKGK